MKVAFIIGASIFLLLGYTMFRVINRIEMHGEEIPKDTVEDRSFIHGIISIFLYPLMCITFVVGLSLFILLVLIFQPKRILPIVRIIARTILFSSGFLLIIKGKEHIMHPKPFILMFNHQSLYDAFILGAVLFRYIVALGASYQFDLPVWGTVVQKWGNIPIQRRNIQAAIKAIELAKKKLADGTSIFIAPEGTRTIDGKMLPFKKGPFHMALGAKADILPMAIRGAFEIKRKTDWRINPGVVEVEFGPVIPFEEYEGMSVEELRDYVRVRIQKLVGDIE
ncbi:MAG: 1-acyl-sn-glycerol-3-phosphate acyltransferase [Candidatus Marinimicrobia bacterium]|nr:1-acyl-sn-glycerol-3-phosphate acyltransferase [Candidatus Neomarinimicrobiota bacterium]